MTNRGRFLASFAAIGASAAMPLRARAADAAPYPRPVARALILSGGGARGAYQAGIITGLAARAGVVDGEALRPYGLVCGTSIGALNAWFVATGQYGALRRAWKTLGASNIFALKSKYVTLDRPHSFIGARIRAALRLASGLTTHEMGIANSDTVLAWLQAHIDPQIPLVTPMIWSVTNLNTQSAEYFYRLPDSIAPTMSDRFMKALRYSLGEDAVIRKSSDATLHRELLASAAVPIVFDPVVLDMADGGTALYADGGIASNVTVAVARVISQALDIVLVDPPTQSHRYENAVDVTIGSYETMQRAIIESEMRHLYFESLAKRASRALSPGDASEIERRAPVLETLIRDLPATELAYKRPSGVLDASFASFDDQAKLDATFAIGEADSATPFTPYAWETFRA